MLLQFQGSSIFLEVIFSHFFSVTTSANQLLSRSGYFLRTAAFLEELFFFKTVTSMQQLFFQNSYFFRAKLLPSSHFLRISSYYRAVTFWNSYLFGTEQLLHSIKFFERATFCEKLIFWRSNNPHYLFFRKTVLSITATFSKELLFHNMLFQKKYNFTATLPFHSCTSCVSVCN